MNNVPQAEEVEKTITEEEMLKAGRLLRRQRIKNLLV